MKIGVVGSGGREHALVSRLASDPGVSEVIALPGNGGTPRRVELDPGDFEAVHACCEREAIDLLVVGPETQLVAGLVDTFDGSRTRVFGPRREAARLEGSKIWAKGFMRRHGVATAASWAFDRPADPDAQRVLSELGGESVIKYDGLAAGKGVYVCADLAESQAALLDLAARFGADARCLIERRCRGVEVSILGFTDGRTIRLLPVARDHKRLLDGDRGPNTGGMGAFAPVPSCRPEELSAIEREIIQPTLAGLMREPLSYCGVIYFGIMLTADGPRLLEYNVRLGDPEAEVLLPALEGSLTDLLLACLEGRLAECVVRTRPGSWVDVVLASAGYPGRCETGIEIQGLDALPPGVQVFHAATRRDGERLVTTGGRVLNVVAHGADLGEASARAYAAVEHISFEGMQYRTDVGRSGGGP